MWQATRTVLLFTCLLLYVVTFWGRFDQDYWPDAVRAYASCLHQGCLQFYKHCVGSAVVTSVHQRWVWAGCSLLFGGLIPAVVMLVLRRRPAEFGLGKPNRWGWRVTLIGVLITVPFAFAFAQQQVRLVPGKDAGWWPAIHYLMTTAAVLLPEHLLLTGIVVAALLPAGRLPVQTFAAAGEGHGRRLWRWLGLAQPAPPGAVWWGRWLAWWGLDGPAFVAIAGGGLLFGIVHMGAHPFELATSFPGGTAVCYLSYRSRSIWPGLLVHLAQVAFVAAFMTVGRMG